MIVSKSDQPLARLVPWLHEHIPGFQNLAGRSKFLGGRSNLTYRIEADSGEYVLRRRPFGKLLPSAHAVDRENCILVPLAPTRFSVTRPLALCWDRDAIGTDFYVMHLVAGRAFWCE